jgi:AcrR family transcriptional regulator
MERPPRERMVHSAAQLIRRHGVSATGIREVVDHAAAPRGSVQHYFPGGKEQLVNEAVDWAGRYAARRVERFVSETTDPTPGKLFAAMVRQWTDSLRADGFEAGCPLVATAVDGAGMADSTRAHLIRALDGWRRPVTDALVDMGVPRRRAADLATLMISALEGAIILARVDRSVRPLNAVARELTPLLDAA